MADPDELRAAVAGNVVKQCVFPFLSRTGPMLPAALFVGNRLHTPIQLERRADGYEAIIPNDMQRFADSGFAQEQGIAIRDLDAPGLRPLCYTLRDGWSRSASHSRSPATLAHELALSGYQGEDIWPTASLSTALPTLLAAGYDLEALVQAVFLELLDRPADIDGGRWLFGQMRRRSPQISDFLTSVMSSEEFLRMRHSLTDVRGRLIERLLLDAKRFYHPIHRQARNGRTVGASQRGQRPTIQLTGGWWKPEGKARKRDHWMSCSAAIVIHPERAGTWRWRGIRSARDAGIGVARWRLRGAGRPEGGLVDEAGDLHVDFTTDGDGPVILELEAEHFFTPSHVLEASSDHRSLSICFDDFELDN